MSETTPTTRTDCAFCTMDEDAIIARAATCYAISSSQRPEGSTIIIPLAHREAPWDLSARARTDLNGLLAQLKDGIDREHHPDGWNVGWNVGRVGGQTVPHAHCHLIPRYRDEPYAGRGVRWWFKQEENRRAQT